MPATTPPTRYLILTAGPHSDRLLASRTNRAAAEMRQRLGAALPAADLAQLFVGTFHRLALTLLQWAGRPCGLILDQVEARQALALARREANAGGRGRQTAAAISLAKASGDPAAFLADTPDLAAWRAYQARLAAFQARDFDDLLLDLRDALREDARLAEQLRERFPQLLVDEFQDVNGVQYDLVRLLAGDGRGLLVIGDPDQAIYGFRGASPGFFDRLMADFPAATRFQLRRNYRCQGAIAAAAERAGLAVGAVERRLVGGGRGLCG